MYDVIVIGGGNAGLVSALTLQKSGKKVLLVEKNNTPGGVATSFIRGNFEFESSLQELLQYGDNVDKGDVKLIFENLGIDNKVIIKPLKETFNTYNTSKALEYHMPVGLISFANRMEVYFPNSKEKVLNLWKIAKELEESLRIIKIANKLPDKTKYESFYTFKDLSLKEGLNKLGFTKDERELLESYWVYLSSPSSNINFIHYTVMLYHLVKEGPAIPISRSYEITLTLLEEFKNAGGTILLNTKVNQILVDNNKVTGVLLSNGVILNTNHIISNISPTITYKELIQNNKLPDKVNKNLSIHTLGARSCTVYLGLNKSPKSIGLKNYLYFIYNTLDSVKEYKNMQKLYSNNVVATVLNNAVFAASRPNSTILTINSFIFSDDFDKKLDYSKYYELKEKIADHLIKVFENGLGINIRDYIEEIEIATPLTYKHYLGHPDGTTLGYVGKGIDNMLERIFNEDNEVYIKGLRFAGGFGTRLSGYSSTYINGYEVAIKTLKEME